MDCALRPAPAWMRVRLALCGQRPINNVVDVSNYVMLETGQPLHFYDAAAIRGARLEVRAARDGEQIVTLDDVTRRSPPNALVIADAQRPLCLAGLMGAAAGEVHPQTTAIVLEAANFEGARVRRMSAALGVRTEASSRHEKSLPLAFTDAGAARAASLLADFGATPYAPRAYGRPVEPNSAIALAVKSVDRLLGLQLSPQRIAEHLEALGCEVHEAGSAQLEVRPPLWRRDLTIEADLIEEIARVEGYDRIPAIVPSVAPHEISSAAYALERRIAHALAGFGYREIVTHSLRDAGEVAVRNPLSEEQRFLRDSLVPGMLEYFTSNRPARAFEIGDVFAGSSGGVEERALLAFGFACTPVTEPAWRDTRFLELKGDYERLVRHVTGRTPFPTASSRRKFHPGKTAVMSLESGEIGYLGAIDPRLSASCDLPGGAYLAIVDLRALPPYLTPHYRVPSKFPLTYRDVAVIVDAALPARELELAAAAELGALCTSVRAFDEYRGAPVEAGRKSLALRVILQRFDATITDEEADAAIARLVAALEERFGAQLRR